MCWKITGPGVPDLRIHAESFDEALKRARMADSRYCGGYVDEDWQTAHTWALYADRKEDIVNYYYKILDCDIYWGNKRNGKQANMPIYKFVGKIPNGYWPIFSRKEHEYYYPKTEAEAKGMIEVYLDKYL